MTDVMESHQAPEDMQTAFIREAIWNGPITDADSILALDPGLADSGIFTAAILGNADLVKNLLDIDPSNATKTALPYGGNALVYLCMSKYLRRDRERNDEFLRAARALLEAGADANSGFWVDGQYPDFETALYGAAGVNHDASLTKLLLEYGADPNDGEAVYHSPETDDNGAMMALVETGRLTPDSQTLMLVRKHDWHDYYGVRYLLEKGVNPNGRWGNTSPFQHALTRVNDLAIITLLLDHGADASMIGSGLTAAARAAREGRSDVLAAFRDRGIAYSLEGLDELIEACAFADAAKVNELIGKNPALLQELMTMSDELLAKFAGCGNAKGVGQLLDIGVKVDQPYVRGDGYFEIPAGSMAIHVAAWRGFPEVVELLIDRGSPADIPDANGRTPLQLAVRACVSSYWTDRRSPDSVAVLLKAGARADSISLPTGYPEIDRLLEAPPQ